MCEKLETLKTGNSLRITELDHISQNPFLVGETKFLETKEVMCPPFPLANWPDGSQGPFPFPWAKI